MKFPDRNVSLSVYKSTKIKMLERDFKVLLTPADRRHMDSLKSEIAVDQYARTLVKKRLGGD